MRPRYTSRPIAHASATRDDCAMLKVEPERFTLRQRQVVELIARGCSNVEIAERLGISPRTAKAHSDTLRAKLRVSRRRQIPAAFREMTGEDPHGLAAVRRPEDEPGPASPPS
jgi:DNA-binding NarL/FixJ family response regulator